MGIDPKAATGDSYQKIPLSVVYTGLQIQQPKVGLGEIEVSTERRRVVHPRTLSALALLNREKYLVLLGDPGSGKTTFVNFVALCLSGERLKSPLANIRVMTASLPFEADGSRGGKSEEEKRQPWEHGSLLPVRIALRDLAARGLLVSGATKSRDTLWKFIEAELGNNLKDFAPHFAGWGRAAASP